MLNAYGPTETTVCATVSGRLEEGSAPLIGKAIRGMRVYVLDERQEVLPQRSSRRAMCRRSGSGERVLEQGGADGRKVRAGRVRRGERGQTISDRGSSEVDARRRATVPGEARRAGEGERVQGGVRER